MFMTFLLQLQLNAFTYKFRYNLCFTGQDSLVLTAIQCKGMDAVYPIDDDNCQHNAYQRPELRHHHDNEIFPNKTETEARARYTAGPQIHTTTPRSRSKDPGVHLVEVTQCCRLAGLFPCLRKAKIWCVQVSPS